MKQFSEEEFQESFRLVAGEGNTDRECSVDEFDKQILCSTLRHVRWRRRSRHVGILGLVLAVFGLGILCGRKFESVIQGQGDTKLVGKADDEESSSPNEPNSSESKAEDRQQAQVITTTVSDPLELRRRVLDASHEERIKLLSEAGDIYLGRNQLEEAVNCYRQVIELTAERPVIEPDDSWLLAELKQSSLLTKSFAGEIDR